VEKEEMKAAVIYKPGDIRVIEKEIPIPSDHEVLIRIKACGVCGTDHSLYTGGFPANYPVTIGHEFSGQIAAIGKEVQNLKIGDRVTVDPNRVCKRCEYCRMGKEHLCKNLSSMGVHIDGADADYCVMVESNVYKIPDNVSFEAAAFTEPLACAVHGLEMGQVQHGDTVLILGAGGMGNLLSQLCALAGAANVIVSEPIARRREIVLENGATRVLDPFAQDVDRELRKVRSIGADVVFEAVGNLKLQAQSVYYARKGGTVVWFGCSPIGRKIEIDPYYINDAEISVRGSFNNPFTTARAVRLLGSEKIRTDNLISHHIEIDNYLEVFNIFGGPDTLKLVVRME
jgi:2-desacetyl-2-hydroxyethyl bacteriochlorophyllide A dehydrogenase